VTEAKPLKERPETGRGTEEKWKRRTIGYNLSRSDIFPDGLVAITISDVKYLLSDHDYIKS